MKTLRCSSMTRFMTCSGFLTLKVPEQLDSDAAREGTAFAELIECRLKNQPVGERATNGVFFDSEAFYYADVVMKNIPPYAESEQKVSFKPSPAHDVRVEGTFDLSWEEDDGDTLVVADIKYGYGLVEVEHNWQLLSYVIGQVFKKEKAYSKYVLRIIQPRPHHEDGWVRDWLLTPDELKSYFDEMIEQVKKYGNGDISFVTSKNCKYCPSLGQECAAISKAFFNSVDVVMNEPIQDSITNEELSNMLYLFERVKDVLKIKSDSLSALATSRITK